MRHVGRRGCAGLVLLGTLGLVAVFGGSAPDAGADTASAHDHSAAPDPLTVAVLLANVVVIGILAVLSRRTPPGVREPARPSGRWAYRERPGAEAEGVATGPPAVRRGRAGDPEI
ncbi:hypothetical protein [Plantactinospora mayteni]|uniref:hypothetical protein n=1 Tax=Plantactinospora mayteni TaxID=566021 RepID=UPI001940628B|nr:hypothetical protein [Plantactinospora mayteni]